MSDFVYTGEILIEDFQTGERAMDVLRDLLELLDTAESWNLQDFKAQIEWLIADKLKLVSPETYTTSEWFVFHGMNDQCSELL
jgi:hypothetical protein